MYSPVLSRLIFGSIQLGFADSITSAACTELVVLVTEKVARHVWPDWESKEIHQPYLHTIYNVLILSIQILAFLYNDEHYCLFLSNNNFMIIINVVNQQLNFFYIKKKSCFNGFASHTFIEK